MALLLAAAAVAEVVLLMAVVETQTKVVVEARIAQILYTVTHLSVGPFSVVVKQAH